MKKKTKEDIGFGIMLIVLGLGVYQTCQSIAWVYERAMDGIAAEVKARNPAPEMSLQCLDGIGCHWEYIR